MSRPELAMPVPKSVAQYLLRVDERPFVIDTHRSASRRMRAVLLAQVVSLIGEAAKPGDGFTLPKQLA